MGKHAVKNSPFVIRYVDNEYKTQQHPRPQCNLKTK